MTTPTGDEPQLGGQSETTGREPGLSEEYELAREGWQYLILGETYQWIVFEIAPAPPLHKTMARLCDEPTKCGHPIKRAYMRDSQIIIELSTVERERGKVKYPPD